MLEPQDGVGRGRRWCAQAGYGEGSGMRLEGKEDTVLTPGTDWSQDRAGPSGPGPGLVHVC